MPVGTPWASMGWYTHDPHPPYPRLCSFTTPPSRCLSFTLRHTHAQELRARAVSAFALEARVADDEAAERRARLQSIKERKLAELRAEGVPEKFLVDLVGMAV